MSIDDAYACLKHDILNTYSGDITTISQSLTPQDAATTPFELLKIIGRGGRLENPVLEQLIQGKDAVLRAANKKGQAQFASAWNMQLVPAIEAILIAQGGTLSQKKLVTPTEAVREAFYGQLHSAFQPCTGATDFIKLYNSACNEEYDLLKAFKHDPKKRFTKRDLELLIALPDKASNASVMTTKVLQPASPFLKAYANVTPLLTSIKNLEVTYTSQETELAGRWKEFWQRHGHNINTVLHRHGNNGNNGKVWDTFKKNLEEVVALAEVLKVPADPGNAYNVDLSKLRDVLTANHSLHEEYNVVLDSIDSVLLMHSGLLDRNRHRTDADFLTAASRDFVSLIGNRPGYALEAVRQALKSTQTSSVQVRH